MIILLVPSIEIIYIGGMLSSSNISRKGFPLQPVEILIGYLSEYPVHIPFKISYAIPYTIPYRRVSRM